MELCERVSSPKFTHPSNIGIYGNTGTGKTHFLQLLLSRPNDYFVTPNGEKIERIVYCYGSVWQPAFNEMEKMGIVMHQGLPTNVRSLFGQNNNPGIIVLDDLQSELENNLEVQQLLTKNAHHLNLTSIIVFQSLYPPGKYATVMRSQFSVLIFFGFRNESRTLRLRFRDYVPKKNHMDSFMKIYRLWTDRKGSYMIVDNHPMTHCASVSIRTNILKEDGPPLSVLFK